MAMKQSGIDNTVVPLRIQRDDMVFRGGFSGLELGILRFAIEGLRSLDPSVDANFSGCVRLIIHFFPLKLSQKEIAGHLVVTPMTLQRWSKGKSLPYALPRRAYVAAMLLILEERLSELTGTCPPADVIDGEPSIGDLLNAADVCNM
jgi:hypothetical protein